MNPAASAFQKGATKDVLDEMTKEELVRWVRGSMRFYFEPPRLSDVYFFRWQVRSDKIQQKRGAHGQVLADMNLAHRDELARQFNSATDNSLRIQLLEKLEPYDKKLQAWWANDTKIRQEQACIDKLYESISIEREKETEAVRLQHAKAVCQ